MIILNLFLGILLIFTGRKLFWLFVGGMGFIVSLNLVLQLFRGQPILILLLIALIVGGIGALLAIFVQKAAIIFGGFLAGAYLLGSLSGIFHLNNQLNWVLYLIGGILGGVFVAAVFEWSLIVLSSLVGALLIVREINLAPGLAILGGLLLFLVGVGIQASVMSRESHPKPT